MANKTYTHKYNVEERKVSRKINSLVVERNATRRIACENPQLEKKLRKKYDDLNVRITFLNHLIENKYAVEWKNGY